MSFRRLPVFFLKHPVSVFTAAAVLILPGLFLLCGIHWTGDISAMLPRGSRSSSALQMISSSGLFNRTLLIFESGSDPVSEQEVLLEKTALSLRKIQGCTSVFYRWLPEEPVRSFSELLFYLPQLISPDKMMQSDPQKTVQKIFRGIAVGAPASARFQLMDPCALSAEIFRRADAFRSFAGFHFDPSSGLLSSRDGMYALMILNTDIPPSNPVRAGCFLNEISKITSSLPHLKTHVISPYLHTVGNDEILKKDIRLAVIASILVFGLLFVIVYRMDYRTLLIPLIPFLISGAVLGYMSLIWETELLFIAGMGGIVVSLAVDYGIHLYGMLRNGKSSLHHLPHLFCALLAGAGTSAGAFAMFLLSGAPGMRQFGFFAGVSLIFSMLIMFVLLPFVFIRRRGKIMNGNAPFKLVKKHPVPVLWIGLILLVSGVFFLCRDFRIHTDFRTFDAAANVTASAEKVFRNAFQVREQPVMLLIRSQSPELLFEDTEKAAFGLRKAGIACFTFSDVFPSGNICTQNLSAWRKYLKSGAFAEYERIFRKEAVQCGFRPEAFQTFFNSLKQGISVPPDGVPEIFKPIAERMISGNCGIVFFPDSTKNRERVRALGLGPVISQKGVASMIGTDMAQDLRLPVILAVLLAVGTAAVYFKNLRGTICALIPPVVSILAVSVLFLFRNGGLDFAVLISMTILAGIAIDYGIFTTTVLEKNENDPRVFNSVTLSALTTAAGGAVVVFAAHPILNSAGLAILTGSVSAWLAAMFLCPLFYAFRPSGSQWPVLLFPLLLLTGCQTQSPFPEPAFEPITSLNGAADQLFKMQENEPREFISESGIVVEFKSFSFTVLSLAKVNMLNREISTVVMTPAGTKFFEASGKNGVAGYYAWLPETPWKNNEKAAADSAVHCLEAIFLNNIPPSTVPIRLENGKWVADYTDKNGFCFHYVFAAPPLSIYEKSCSKNGKRLWKLKVYSQHSAGNSIMPKNMIYDNFEFGYRLIIRTRKVRVLK